MLFTLIAVCSFRSLTAQTADTVKLTNRQSMLNGKFFLDFPVSAVNQQRPVDIMSTDRNINEETRIVIDNGDERLVVFAQELHSLADASFEQKVRAEDNSKFGFQRQIVYDVNGYQAIMSVPTVFDSTRPGILINTILLRSPDGTVSSLGAMISPQAYKNKAYYTALTERIFRSLTPGTRVTDLSAREEKIPLYGTEKAFRFQLPANHYLQVDQKYDFQVIKIMHYQPYGEQQWQGATIYLGDHPSWFYRDYGFKKESGKLQNGKFLGKKIEWMEFENASEKTLLKEQQISADHLSKGLIVHIALYGSDASDIETLQQIIEGIGLVK
jgi:hypothetical protein